MNHLRARGVPSYEAWDEPLDDERAVSPSLRLSFEERPPRRSGDWRANPGRRLRGRPAEEEGERFHRPPGRRSDAGSGLNGPPRGPFGSGARWSEPGDDAWPERPARRPRRPVREEWEPGPGAARRKRPGRKKLPLTAVEKRRRWYRYLALLGVMAFASLGGVSLSFSLVVLGVICLVCCLPCAALFLYF